MPGAKAQTTDPDKILKAMSDYVTSQKTLSITFDSDIEVITSGLQKIQFTSSGQVQLSRPDKLRATRTGGYNDVEIVFDGKTFTINDKDANAFAQIEAAGSIDQLIDLLRDGHGITAPGADLLFSNAFEVIMGDVIDSAYVGKGVIDGVECDHLAFRNPGDRLADLDRARRPADPAQIRDHQQDRRRRAAIHAAHQGVEDGRFRPTSSCSSRLRAQPARPQGSQRLR